MRIGDMVTAAMGNIGLVERPRQNLALQALTASGDDSGGFRPKVAPTRMAAVDAPQEPSPESPAGDTVELTSAGAETAPAPDQPKPDPNAALTGLVEKFIRKRAIFAYSQPSKIPGGPSFDFVMEVEVAYRVIEPTQPGTTLDIQA
ncbi:MAG: hypothetical protein JNJ48_04725 [Phycisphaerae bacterium]|nr:hypothetical protein [Phycisphaerae bacterium]